MFSHVCVCRFVCNLTCSHPISWQVKAYERDMHDKLNRIMELQTECATLERKLEESEEVKTQLQEHINASKEV